MADERMIPERAEIVIEEIVTTIRQFTSDDKGLAVVRVTLVRPSSDRCFIDYRAEEEGEG